MLRKLHTAANPTTLTLFDAFSVSNPGWYLPRYDAAWYASSVSLGSYWRIFRDGTVVRMCAAANAVYGYDTDADRVIYCDGVNANLYHDPMSNKQDPSMPATLTRQFLFDGTSFPVVWHGAYYALSFLTIQKHHLTTGATLATSTLAGSLTWSAGGRFSICDDGTLVAICLDNGTTGVVRFFDLNTNVNLYEATIAKSKFVCVDRVHRNIWSIRAVDGILEVYSFEVEPAALNPFTVGANRSRYRQDAIATTVVGNAGEPVAFCPVAWTLDPPDSGHLEFAYTLTDAEGVARNTYCGPQDAALVGTDVTIAAWTAGV